MIFVNKQLLGGLENPNDNYSDYKRNFGLNNYFSADNVWNGKLMYLKCTPEFKKMMLFCFQLTYSDQYFTGYFQAEYVGENYNAEVVHSSH